MKFSIAFLSAVFMLSFAAPAAAQQKVDTPANDGWKNSRTASSPILQADSDRPCVDGMAGQFPCENVDLLAFMPIDSIGGRRSFDGKPLTSLNDIWGWTDADTGREYALVGRTDGTSFVDVTDPRNPVYLGNLPAHNSQALRGQSSTWRDIKTLDHYAYIVMDLPDTLHGLQIFDLHELRSVDDVPVTFAETAHYSGFSAAHNIVINTDTRFAYAVGTNVCRGLFIMDLQDPLAPAYRGCFADTRTGRFGNGYTHDAQCVVYSGPDIDYQGQEICFASNESHVLIADLSNKAQPSTISIAAYPNVRYAHQGWLTPDHRFFLQDDELDELYDSNVKSTRTLIWDMEDLDDPQLADIYVAPTTSIDHNQYTVEDRVFQSNYTSGLRILDISDPASAIEVGFFDTYPAHDSARFDGTWSNYPYFESGNLILTGIDEGLFVVRPTGIADVGADRDEVPAGFQLLPPYPNPFTSRTTVALLVEQPQQVRVAIFDARGKKVIELYSGFVAEPGRIEFVFDADDLASGVYFIRAFGASGSRSTAVTLQK